jgi:membrane-associated phospholipid phosphatase
MAAFFALSVPVWQNDVAGWDAAVSKRIHAYENRDTAFDRVDPFSIVLGLKVQGLGLLVVLAAAAILALHGKGRRALFLVLGVVGAAVLAVVLKDVFERPPVDPNGSGYSFPSGHALRSGAAAIALGVVAWPTRLRWPVAAVATLVAVTVGVGVVYHEWHWASDTLAGWSIAIAWIASVWLVLRPRSGGTPSVEPAAPGTRTKSGADGNAWRAVGPASG